MWYVFQSIYQLCHGKLIFGVSFHFGNWFSPIASVSRGRNVTVHFSASLRLCERTSGKTPLRLCDSA